MDKELAADEHNGTIDVMGDHITKLETSLEEEHAALETAQAEAEDAAAKHATELTAATAAREAAVAELEQELKDAQAAADAKQTEMQASILLLQVCHET